MIPVLIALPLFLVAALWSVGVEYVLPPAGLGALAGAGLLASLLALGLGFAKRIPRRRALWWSGLIGLAGLVVFLGALFHRGEGAIDVVERVKAPDVPVGRIRLVDLNVLHDHPELRDLEVRLETLGDALRVLDPTVVVLQEAWSVAGHGVMAERLAERLGMDVAYAAANGSRRLIGFEEGSAVLSRLPILEARRVVLAPRAPPWECRIALFTVLDLGGGERLDLVGTHLAAGRPDVADRQAEHLASLLSPEGLLVVAGDLNRGRDAQAVRALTARGLVDAVPDGGIDHVLVRRSGLWVVSRAATTLGPADLLRLLGREARISDHPGLLVDLVRVQ